MSLSAFYKDRYQIEIARKAEIATAISVPLGVVSLLFGLLAVMAKDLRWPLAPLESAVFAVIFTSAFAGVVVVFFLFAAHTGYRYAFFPTAEQLRKQYDDGVAAHKAAGQSDDDAAKKSEAETLTEIEAMYIQLSSENAVLNERKAKQLRKANLALMAAVALGLIAGALYVVSSMGSPTPTQRVEVVKLPLELHGILDTAAAAGSSSCVTAPYCACQTSCAASPLCDGGPGKSASGSAVAPKVTRPERRASPPVNGAKRGVSRCQNDLKR